MLFKRFWHVTQYRKARMHVPQLYIFLIFTSDHKQVVEVIQGCRPNII